MRVVMGAEGRRLIEVGASQEAVGPGPWPAEFRVLDVAEGHDPGELEHLMKVINAMAAALPGLQVSMVLCCLKPGRAFSMAEGSRKLCLVALLRTEGNFPVVRWTSITPGKGAIHTVDYDMAGIPRTARCRITYVAS